jgi:ATP-binding cassette subfamily C (CFTR/MRP) protein 1
MRTGCRRSLAENDIGLGNPLWASEKQSSDFIKAFTSAVAVDSNWPLLHAIYTTFKTEFWIGAVCQLVSATLLVMTPFTLRVLISYANESNEAKAGSMKPPSLKRGLGVVFGITIMQIVQSFTTNHFIYRGTLIGGQVRSCLTAALLQKSLTISDRAKSSHIEMTKNHSEQGESHSQDQHVTQGFSNGHIQNLMSIDVPKIDQAANLFHNTWSLPWSIVLTLGALIVNIRYAALAGYAALVVGMAFSSVAVKNLVSRRKIINAISEQRVSLIQGALQHIRSIKYFGWEDGFLAKVQESRYAETSALRKLLIIRDILLACSLSMPIFATMVSIVTYSYVTTNNALDPARIFSSLALFNALRVPLTLLPMVIGQASDAYVSVLRIQKFLSAEDYVEQRGRFHGPLLKLVVHDADFVWEQAESPTTQPQRKPRKARFGIRKEEKKGLTSFVVSETEHPASDKVEAIGSRQPFKLSDIDFGAATGELIAIIGIVGCGKSSLLAALAGQMRKTRGSVALADGASCAYCPQNAWIKNASVRENILLGHPMRLDHYQAVLKACALTEDISALPKGDLTEVGEKGITLSGGQKQRVNIARAIYSDKDVILLDDPLSAVDTHVGQHIFQNGICGLLQSKCRIMATNDIGLLSQCHRVIWLDGGRVKRIDSFEALGRDPAIEELMKNTARVRNNRERATDPTDRSESFTNTESNVGLPTKRESVNQPMSSTDLSSRNSVPWRIYCSYIQASKNVTLALGIPVLLVFCQGITVATNLWLSYWVSNRFGYSREVYIGVYAALGVLNLFFQLGFGMAISYVGTLASLNLAERAITRVFKAPMSFFETTPLGTILSHFTEDVDTLENTVADCVRLFLMTVAGITAISSLVVVFFHYFAIVLGPLFCIYLVLAAYYKASTSDLKRYGASFRAQVHAQYNEITLGAWFIRVHEAQQYFIRQLHISLDQMNSAFHLSFVTERWVSLRLDMVGSCLLFTTGILVVVNGLHVSPSISGLVLASILSIVQILPLTVRQLASVEASMTATERINAYGTELEQEENPGTSRERIPQSWAGRGEIVFQDVSVRYRPTLPLVLDKVSLTIRGGEHLAIVGRTGAGKSTLVSLLFRIIQLQSGGGSIWIDNVDIATVSLKQLRSRLTIVPQDPSLFQGTLRSNLDPFQEHTEQTLLSALQQVGMVNSEGSEQYPSPIDLSTQVSDDGSDFSHGQRQLVALARAIVRDSQIVVCDEATSSVDLETDRKLQIIMQKAFKHKTVVCIAHRIRTVLHYDRICVVDHGEIKELDTPIRLWYQQGIFRSMCDNSGIDLRDWVGL